MWLGDLTVEAQSEPKPATSDEVQKVEQKEDKLRTMDKVIITTAVVGAVGVVFNIWMTLRREKKSNV